jgi:hypothetical protein
MRGRAQKTQTLNVLLARILELRKSVKLRLPQLEWRKDHPEKGKRSPQKLPHLLHRDDRRMNGMAVELGQKALVLPRRRVEWRRSRSRLHQSHQAALMLALLALLELLQLADRREELLQGPHCISSRKPSNSLQPLVRLQHLVRQLSPAGSAGLGR